MKHFTLSLFLLFCSTAVLAQTRGTYTINGFVTDEATGEKLINAYVFDKVSQQGTTTNAYGFYSMTLPKDSVALQVSYVGYAPYLKGSFLNRRTVTEMDVMLIQDNILEEVEVIGSISGEVQERTQMSSVNLDIKTVKNLPVLLGETDLLKVIQLLPGVQSGTEGTSGFYVRGGGPDQNLILIDGVPVYNVSHLFGFFSVFNADAINNVQLIKGGFPAEYGGRLSSVLDVRMKEGNMKEWKAEGSVGVISSKLTVEGPLWKDRTSMIVSGRRTYLDVLTQPIILANNPNGSGGYYFYDFNAKVNHKINRNNQLYLSFYNGLDEAYIRYNDSYENSGFRNQTLSDNSLNWGNRIATARWNWIVTPKLFSNVTATYSRYRFLTDLNLEENQTDLTTMITTNNRFAVTYLSEIVDKGARWDFDYAPSPNHAIKFGASYTQHAYEPGVNTITFTSGSNSLDTNFGSFPKVADDYVAYFQDDWKIGDRLRVNMGVHFNGFSVDEVNYQSLQPRLSARYLLSEKSSIKWSYVQMAQYMHLLSNQTIGLPTDLWVPVTENIRPQEAWQTALGYAHNLGEGWELTLEGYYKDMQNLIEYKDGASFLFGFQDWQEKVTSGRGWAYGMEFLLEKKSGRTTGWLGYTLAKTMRQFDEINFGNPYPYTYDRRHDVSLTMSHQFNEAWSGGLVWVYGTGRATTLPTRTYYARPDGNSWEPWYYTIDQVSGRNNFREPAYHRLDLSVTHTKQKKWGEASWQFGVYNAYNRINIFFMDFGSDDNGNRVLKGYGLFPMIPSVSYAFKF
jgi:outer membrane receptor for ferrienterochelin and colicin